MMGHEQHGCHFPNNTFKCICWKEKLYFWLKLNWNIYSIGRTASTMMIYCRSFLIRSCLHLAVKPLCDLTPLTSHTGQIYVVGLLCKIHYINNTTVIIYDVWYLQYVRFNKIMLLSGKGDTLQYKNELLPSISTGNLTALASSHKIIFSLQWDIFYL